MPPQPVSAPNLRTHLFWEHVNYQERDTYYIFVSFSCNVCVHCIFPPVVFAAAAAVQINRKNNRVCNIITFMKYEDSHCDIMTFPSLFSIGKGMRGQFV